MACAACGGGDCSGGAFRSDRNERVIARGLPVAFPGQEIETIRIPSSCVSVYVTHRRGPAAAVVQFARVNLFADVAEHRSLIASAFVPLGYSGLAISVAGIIVDAWHVTAQALDTKTELGLGMIACRGCAAPSVLVPRLLQNPPANLPPEFVGGPTGAGVPASSVSPLTPGEGIYRIRTEAGGSPILLDAGERVTGIALRAGAAVATLIINLNGRVQDTISVQPGDTFRLEPAGNLAAPALLTFADALRFVVETVR